MYTACAFFCLSLRDSIISTSVTSSHVLMYSDWWPLYDNNRNHQIFYSQWFENPILYLHNIRIMFTSISGSVMICISWYFESQQKTPMNDVIVTCLGRCYVIVHVFPGQKRPNKSKVYISFQQEHHDLALHVVYFCHNRTLDDLIHILCRYSELKRLYVTANFLSVYLYTTDFHYRLSSAIFIDPL